MGAQTIRKLARRFAAGERGSVAMIFAFAGPVFTGLCAAGLDYSFATMCQAEMQRASDMGAIVGAKQFALASATTASVKSTAESAAKSNLTARSVVEPDSVTAIVTGQTVKVEISRYPTTFLMKYLGFVSFPIVTTSTAIYQGSSTPLCILTLDPALDGDFSMQGGSVIKAPNCAVQSNSRSTNSMQNIGQGLLTTAQACASGGFVGTGFSPRPTTDCPAIPDPLAKRPLPYTGGAGCDYNNTVVDTGSRNLNPGVYCGGLAIQNSASVNLAPGIYVMKDGPLKVNSFGSMSGTNVGFYLTGTASVLGLLPASTISLTAPATGPMAGMLFQEDPSSPALRQHVISSANGAMLLGTIYLPQGKFFAGGQAQLGGSAAYTIIVARQMVTGQNPVLTLNTNYGSTNIPVPNGVGPTGGGSAGVRLIQ
jgi:Flp pilus assembly protein TadG